MSMEKKQSYEIVPMTEESSQDSEESLKKTGKGGKCKFGKSTSMCSNLLRNKCCIACLVFIGFVFIALIGIKITISALLREDEFDFDSDFVLYGQNFSSSLQSQSDNSNSSSNGTVNEESLQVKLEHFMETWEAPEEIASEVFYYRAGHDKDKKPVWIVPQGIWDLRKLLTGGTDEENERNIQNLHIFFDQFHYRVQKSLKESPTGKWVMIGDMAHYSYGQLWSWTTTSFNLKLAKKFEAHLDTLDYGFMVNLDMVSKAFVGMMKPVLGAFLDRLEPYSTDKEYFSSFMLQKIPADQLPEMYGGTAKDNPQHLAALS